MGELCLATPDEDAKAHKMGKMVEREREGQALKQGFDRFHPSL